MSFEKAIAPILKAEGGYTNDAEDSGGPTNWGITQGDLKSWRGQAVSADDVRNMSKEEALKIYKAKYWTPMHLDEIKNENIQLILFDQGVNRGIKTAAIQAQMTLQNLGNKLSADGDIGEKTQGIMNSANTTDFCREYLQASTHAYVDIVKRKPSQIVFLKGWINRVHALEDIVWTNKTPADLPAVSKPDMTGAPAPVVEVQPGAPKPVYWKPHIYHPMFKVPAPYTHLHPLDILRSVAGEKEIPGSKDNALIAHFHEHAGNLGKHSDTNDYSDEVPHCSSAWQWACDGGGCYKTDNALASSWDNYVGYKLKKGETVLEGDLIRLARPGGHITAANVGGWKWTGTGTFEGFGSNQDNMIKTSIYSQSTIVSIHRVKPLPGTVLAPIGILGHKPVPVSGNQGESTT